jgi:hypothetical protein
LRQKARNDQSAERAAAALTVVTDHSTAVSNEDGVGGGEMGKKHRPEDLTEEELEETNGEPLPDRQAMSLIRAQPLPEPVFPIDPTPGEVMLDDPKPGT